MLQGFRSTSVPYESMSPYADPISSFAYLIYLIPELAFRSRVLQYHETYLDTGILQNHVSCLRLYTEQGNYSRENITYGSG